MRTINPFLYLQRVGTRCVASNLSYGLSLSSFESVAGAVGFALSEVPRSEGMVYNRGISELTRLINGYSDIRSSEERVKAYQRICTLLALGSDDINPVMQRIDPRNLTQRYDRYVDDINLPQTVPPPLKASLPTRMRLIRNKQAIILRILKEHGELRGKDVAARSDGHIGLGSVYAELAGISLTNYVDSREGAPDAGSEHNVVFWHLTDIGDKAPAAFDAYPTMTPVKMFWLSAFIANESMGKDDVRDILGWTTSIWSTLWLGIALRGLRRDQLISQGDNYSITDAGTSVFSKWREVFLPYFT